MFVHKISLIAIQVLLAYADIPTETYFDTGERIEYFNYTSETHHVTTEDGYILTLFRIPGANNCDQLNDSVLLTHAFLATSSDFVYAGPTRALAFLLADECYDVWLGNRRGNRYSRQHTTLNPNTDNAKFYDFSLHESGYYDAPAMVDYILNTTENDAIFYVGHSQGNTDFFIMASERPEYNEKIKLALALAPGVYLNHVKSPIAPLARSTYFTVDFIGKAFDITELFPRNQLFTKIEVGLGNNDDSITTDLLLAGIFLIIGFDYDQVDRYHLPSYLSEVPSPSSYNSLKHFIQWIKSGVFAQYDYGLAGNLLKYRNIHPPTYNLKNVVAPVFIQYANNDWLNGREDIERLINELPNVESRNVPYEEFNHLDYIWSKDIVDLVNYDIVKIIQKYSV